MREDERDKHTPTRSIRMGDRWDTLGEVYGDRARSKLLEQVAAWLLREKGARLPERISPARRHLLDDADREETE